MVETPLKRQRDDTQIQIEDFEESKRHKSYNHILSLLEEEEDEPTQDLSSLITTLQQELSSDSTFELALSCPVTELFDQENLATLTTPTADSTSSSASSSTFGKEDEEDDKERVIRHLLEASDDELGIPNRDEVICGGEDGDEGCVNGGDGFINGVDGFSLCDGLWEFEDANANYYAMLQSQLFM